MATMDVKQQWSRDAQYFEYTTAANPIGSGLTSRVPLADLSHRLDEEGPTRIIPFDLSEQLNCPGPATSPALCANFIRILAGERIDCDAAFYFLCLVFLIASLFAGIFQAACQFAKLAVGFDLDTEMIDALRDAGALRDREVHFGSSSIHFA